MRANLLHNWHAGPVLEFALRVRCGPGTGRERVWLPARVPKSGPIWTAN
jgi:hypothetical protein